MERENRLTNQFAKLSTIVEVKTATERANQSPPNFGVVVPELIVRGGWPNDLDQLKKMGVLNVVSLVSTTSEQTRAQKLTQTLANQNLKHLIININSTQDYVKAARKILEFDSLTYIHCSAGSNRTGIVSILISLLTEKNHDLNFIETIITDALIHGFDYEKAENIHTVIEVLGLIEEQSLP